MGSTKNSLAPYSIITNGAMTGNLTSTTTAIKFIDNVGIQLVWTGTPTGTFGVQVSLDNVTYTPLVLSPGPAATGSAGNYYIDLNQLSAAYIQVTYTFTSGTGTLNALITGKAV